MGFENLVGHTLGRYELRALLGAGGMGAVYRAYQANLRREVAVKVLPASLSQDAGSIARFNREAEVSASLEHAHIVPVHDYGTENGVSYVVMRLLTGGSLADRLRAAAEEQRPLPSLQEIAAVLRQLAGALDYAHGRGVIHRDIKPGNIMFDNQGDAFLVDFGIAKLLTATTHLTGTGMGVGTPSFMPPEQWRSEALTPAADQYAMGVVIYNMLTGRLPFEADTPFQAMHKALNEQPTPPQTYRADMPPSVSLVLDRALAKDPGARFPTMTAFAQAFDSAISGIETQGTGFFLAPVPTRAATRVPTTPGAPTPGGPPRTPIAPRRTVPPPAPRRRISRTEILICALIALVVVVVFGVLQAANNSANEASANATLTAIAAAPTVTQTSVRVTDTLAPSATERVVAAVPTQSPVPATDTLAPSATERVVAAVPTQSPVPATDTAVPTPTPIQATDTLVPTVTSTATATASGTPTLTLVPTDTSVPTLSPAQLSATAAPLASETARLAAEQSQTAAFHVTAQAVAMLNQTMSAQIQQTQTALAASPTPSMTPTATDTPVPTDTLAPTDTLVPTNTSTPSATTAPTDTPVPTDTLAPTDTPMPPTATPTEPIGPHAFVPAGQPIIIGLSTTLSGQFAPVGVDIRRALELALDQRPTVTVDGHHFDIQLGVLDDQCGAARARDVAASFIGNPSVAGVIGPMCSSGCRAAAPIFDGVGFSSISPSCTARDLTTSEFASFNRTVAADAIQGQIAAQFIYHILGVRRIATVVGDTALSQGMVEVVSAAYTEMGGEVVASVELGGAPAATRRALTNLMASQPDLIFFGGTVAQVNQFISRSGSAIGSLPLMAYGLGGQTTPIPGSYAIAPISADPDAEQAFLKTYRETYGEDPSGFYHFEAYDAFNVMLDAIEYAGHVDADGNLIIDREMLAGHLRNFRHVIGLSGLLNGDSSGEMADAHVGLYREVNGSYVSFAEGRRDLETGGVVVSTVTP